jgi:hypothetical protein
MVYVFGQSIKKKTANIGAHILIGGNALKYERKKKLENAFNQA